MVALSTTRREIYIFEIHINKFTVTKLVFMMNGVKSVQKGSVGSSGSRRAQEDSDDGKHDLRKLEMTREV